MFEWNTLFKCTPCGGNGRTVRHTVCPFCNGAGYLTETGEKLIKDNGDKATQLEGVESLAPKDQMH